MFILIFHLFLSFNIFAQDNCDCERENRITAHNAIYAVSGEPNTKIQISLKYKLFKAADLFIAYTQTMFWDIADESSPFKDVNYNPELFYRIKTPNAGILESIDIGIFEHKSNGRSGVDSRGWSRSYIKFNTITRFNKWSFNWDTKIFAFYQFSLDKTNLDIRDYTGFWETRIAFTNYFDELYLIDRTSLYFAFFSGGKFSQSISKGGQELGFGVSLGKGRFNPSLFVQLYHGYNESLLDYNKEFWSYRFGLSF